MKRLSNDVLTQRPTLPEKIVQFGEGNFLRGFIDWMIHQMNKQGLFNGSIVAIQPTPHGRILPKLARQDYLYTTVLRGIQENQVIDQAEVVTSISRGINPYSDWQEVLSLAQNKDIQFIFSNTTEAGLAYKEEKYEPETAPPSFPGKLALFLYERFQSAQGDPNSGFYIFPCELVENNGDLLKEIVLKVSQDFGFPEAFRSWIESANHFYNTLVDRIVTGFPKTNGEVEAFYNTFHYEDELLTIGEPYHLFVIDGPITMEELLPFQQVGLNIQWTSVKPFRELKVRILNGLHTMMYAIGLLKGKETVLEVMEDNALRAMIDHCLQQEIFPVLETSDEEKAVFAESVIQRFLNPFNHHQLSDIGLNGLSKFRVRVLPTLLDYIEKYHQVPEILSYSFAASLLYYRVHYYEGDTAYGQWKGKTYPLKENNETLKFLEQAWQNYDDTSEKMEAVVNTILENQTLWEKNLNKVPTLKKKVIHFLSKLLADSSS
ncbi:tagaturonate reductase [Pullulanibacillus pueri]|uniref:Mannitol dehydrogenase n=1 Tax=Pullulanibacillus pueri TaxID=1437324 RepID=A0A8J3EMV3_9BACL|nr:tagaturonate reductase [Pullulanibacillus pueri]MBM7682994.1 tagaturonate reductase [Pullulanibacillus pueri]GGH85925.1 mannitol dehydrogenase [Pullulanibacillus pueri]